MIPPRQRHSYCKVLSAPDYGTAQPGGRRGMIPRLLSLSRGLARLDPAQHDAQRRRRLSGITISGLGPVRTGMVQAAVAASGTASTYTLCNVTQQRSLAGSRLVPTVLTPSASKWADTRLRVIRHTTSGVSRAKSSNGQLVRT